MPGKISDCPKYLPADNPARIQRDATIALMSSEGQPFRQIAAKTGLDKGQISRILSQDRQKEIIDNVISIRIAALKGASKQLVKHVYSDDPKTSLTAIGLLDKSTGIAGSHTAPIYIDKLYQDNRSVELSDNMLSVIKRLEDDNIIDIEVPD